MIFNLLVCQGDFLSMLLGYDMFFWSYVICNCLAGLCLIEAETQGLCCG